MTGKTSECVQAISFQNPPYSFIENREWKGSHILLIEMIFEHIRICINFNLQEEPQFGRSLPNGSWTGMVGNIQRENYDVTGRFLSFTDARSQVMDFSTVVQLTDTRIIYTTLSANSKIFAFVEPFQYEVWITIAILCALLIGVYALILYTYKKNGTEFDVGGTWNRSFSWTYMILMEENVPFWPNLNGVRFLSGLWMLSALVIATYYKGMWKAIIITRRVPIPFDSVDEMVAQSQIGWTYPKANYMNDALEVAYQNDPTSTYGKLFSGKSKLMDSIKVVKETLMRNNRLAVIVTFPVAATVVDEQYEITRNCPFTVTKQGFLPLIIALGMKRNYTLKAAINKAILDLHAFGLIDRTLDEDYKYFSRCRILNSQSGNNNIRPFGVNDFIGTFMIWGSGLFLSLLVFFAEILFPKNSKTKEDI